MKAALILEKDPVSAEATAEILTTLGFVTAVVQTPEQALNVASAIDFDAVVTCTTTIPGDRRSLTGELKRLAPEAAVILLRDGDHGEQDEARSMAEGISGVLSRPFEAAQLRAIVDFGVDGFGLQPAYQWNPAIERRRRQAIS